MIWAVLASGFNLEADSTETRRWVGFLEFERAAQTRDALVNATRYAPRFREIFREQGVPEDLLWLALIESSFMPSRTSPTGAQGMFQFKKDTARAFGLAVTRARDERDMPFLAARAAARYLAYLRGKFASWELVLAAYNLGEGDLRRAMAAREAETWLQIKPYLREETRHYVGKVKAAAVIGNRFIDSLPPKLLAEKAPRVHRVRKGDTLYAIARAYGVPLAELKRANGLSGNLIHLDQELLVPAR